MFLRRLWHLVNRRRRERELVEEMRGHRDLMADPASFGDTHRFIEQSRDAWGWNWLDDAMQDLSVGVRTLLRSPSFAVTATLILTFGIGLNLALFQMASVALMRPPAIMSPETMVRFYRSSPDWNTTSLPFPLIQFVQEHNSVLSKVLAEASSTVAWGEDALAQSDLSLVSPAWFTELGYDAIHGRVFSEVIDGRPDASPAAVLGYHFWSHRLGGDPGVIGTTIYIDRRPFTVVGVAPRALPGLDFDVPAVYVPILQREYLYPESDVLRAWDSGTVAMYARVHPGLSRAAVRDSLRATMQAAAAARSEVKPDEWLEPIMGSHNFMDDRDRAGAFAVIWLLAALTGLVLVVAAANIGNLVLSRATGRVRELGVRMALGARRGRIIRQLVVEAMPLAVLGAIGSVLFSTWTARTIAAVSGIPAYLDFSPDHLTVLAGIALAGASLLVIGVMPAWKVARQDLTAAIKDGGHNLSRVLDRAFMRRVMVAAQVAGSCLLLVVAGMMVRGIQRVVASDLGFDYAKAAVLAMPLGRYGISGGAVRSYWYDVKARALANPEVESAAIVTAPPLGGRVHENAYRDAPRLEILQQSVDPEYFATMRIPLLSGRNFGAGDQASVIVSRRLAIEMYGSVDVLGLGFPKGDPETTIVGVAADAHTIKVNATNVAELYLPLTPEDFSTVFLVARARSDPARLLPVLREAARLDSRVIPSARLMRDDFDRRVRGARIAGAVASGIGAMTLVLACLGIFGVVSYSVALRTKEIGIRTALGALRPSLVVTILRQVLTPVVIGMGIGVLAAVPAGFALGGDPFYLESMDPLVYAGALMIFAAAGIAAALWPALKALRGNPIEALRHP